VLSYDPLTREHMVQYKVDTGIEGEVISFELKEGRYQRETGNTRVAPPVTTTADGQVAAMEPLNERDEAALRVLEQLQRTFCFMQFSKRRYYDPRSFVDACKTLNLNFNVYHQNDAAEFCDQLLDRIENATQGKQTNQNVWNDVIQKQIFGGKSLYQKIPQGCEAYNTDKQECGHWQSSRLESFLKIELLIRGKDKIDDSLAEMIIGELMDGDNKVDCDVCAKKKATIRRTCIGKLPNTMVLHLKRFDLDFQTFETVKLNNRMAFSTRLNMLKYTKEGIEAEERKEQRAAAQALREENADAEEGPRRSTDGGIAYEAPPTGEAELDALDFEYELQGVLVHAGIAQGGHYYSFICDTDTTNAPATLDLNESMNSSEKRWYRFEDEDVSHFSPDQIAPQCFGGPAFNGTQSGEEDRTSNALMLFFNKVRPSDVNEKGPEAAPTSPSPEEDAPKGDKPKETEIKGAPSPLDAIPGGLLVNGYQAFGREVRESNLNHVLSCYVLDTDLHGFVRGLISSISSSAAKKTTPPGMITTSPSMCWSI
jgi:ubiquitin carboxyl-terminal hydrolase 9/24